MKTTQHGDYLTQITRWPRFFPVNVYLVREDDGFTLIDTGMPGGAKDYIQIAATLGAPIKRITLTHAHGDHAGSIDELHAALPEAEVILTARQNRLLHGDLSLDPGEPQSKPKGMWVPRQTQPTRLVEIGAGGPASIGSVQIIAAPGHSPDNIAFLDTRDRSLIAGDAYQTQGGLAVSGHINLSFPFPAMATWDKPTALRSAKALHALNPSRLAVGHGPVIEKPVKAMESAIAKM